MKKIDIKLHLPIFSKSLIFKEKTFSYLFFIYFICLLLLLFLFFFFFISHYFSFLAAVGRPRISDATSLSRHLPHSRYANDSEIKGRKCRRTARNDERK